MEGLSFQYKLPPGGGGLASMAVMPKAFRRTTRAWWSEAVGLYTASMGRGSRREVKAV
jgi:hypothetical protein